MFFLYMYELRLSATMLLNEYDDDDSPLGNSKKTSLPAALNNLTRPSC